MKIVVRALPTRVLNHFPKNYIFLKISRSDFEQLSINNITRLSGAKLIGNQRWDF